MGHMDIEEWGFAIGHLDAGQLLRHMRITSNQQIHFRRSVEQAHYVSVANRLVLGVAPSF